MNHPSQQEWMSYLYGELPAEQRADLKTHLEACPQCRSSADAWQGTMRELSSWNLSKAMAHSKMANLLLKWGIAALLILGFSFGFGRLSARTAPDLKQIQMALAPALREQLRTELTADLQSALKASAAVVTNEFHRELRSEFEQWAANAINNSKLETERVLAGLIQSDGALRQEDRQSVLALVQKLEQQHRADYAKLLKKVETVALVAEERLQRTQNQIGQLVAFAQTDLPSNQ
jgi:hypothetical protein